MTEARNEDDCVVMVMRGLLHELANVATVLDGVRSTLDSDEAAPTLRPKEDLAAATERIFRLHGELRSLLPDHEGPTALDPRAIAGDVARLMAWHVERPCLVAIEEGPVVPILGEAWRLRRQLLAACDSAAAGAAAFRLTLRVAGEEMVVAGADGTVLWAAPTLAAARGRERGGG